MQRIATLILAAGFAVPLPAQTGPVTVVTGAALAPRGAVPLRYIVVPSITQGVIRIIDTTTLAVTVLPTGTRPIMVAMSPDGEFAYVIHGASGGTSISGQFKTQHLLSKVSFRSLSVVQSSVLNLDANAFVSAESNLRDFEIAPDGRTLAILGFDLSYLSLVDTQSLTVTHARRMCTACGASSGPIGAMGQISFSESGQRIGVSLGTMQSHQTLSAADLTPLTTIGLAPAPPQPQKGPIESIRIAGFDEFVIAPFPNTEVWMFDEASGSGFQLPGVDAGQFDGGNDIQLVQNSRGALAIVVGNYSFSTQDTDVVTVFDFRVGSAVDVPTSLEAPTRLIYNEPLNQLWMFCLNAIPFNSFCKPWEAEIIDLNTGVVHRMSGSHTISRNRPTISPDGQRIFLRGPIESGHGTMIAIDAVTRTELGLIQMEPVSQLSWVGGFTQGDWRARRGGG